MHTTRAKGKRVTQTTRQNLLAPVRATKLTQVTSPVTIAKAPTWEKRKRFWKKMSALPICYCWFCGGISRHSYQFVDKVKAEERGKTTGHWCWK